MYTFVTNHGNFEITLDRENAPLTCANFEEYIKAGFYDGTIFHRVIPNFMVQGGGFTADMEQKSTREQIKNEADNGLQNLTGTLAMARTPDPHSAAAQFFINVNDNAFLNHTAQTQDGWGYCVFGSVSSGMDVIMEISMTPTANHGMYQNVPVEPIVIESITAKE